MKLPGKIQICDIPYTIIHAYGGIRDRPDLAGQIDYRTQEIFITHELAPEIKRETLMHEVLHGVVDASGRNCRVSETLIDSLAHLLCRVLDDNPDFVKMFIKD